MAAVGRRMRAKLVEDMLKQQSKSVIGSYARPIPTNELASPSVARLVHRLLLQVYNQKGQGIAAPQLGYPWQAMALRQEIFDSQCFLTGLASAELLDSRPLDLTKEEEVDLATSIVPESIAEWEKALYSGATETASEIAKKHGFPETPHSITSRGFLTPSQGPITFGRVKVDEFEIGNGAVDANGNPLCLPRPSFKVYDSLIEGPNAKFEVLPTLAHDADSYARFDQIRSYRLKFVPHIHEWGWFAEDVDMKSVDMIVEEMGKLNASQENTRNLFGTIATNILSTRAEEIDPGYFRFLNGGKEDPKRNTDINELLSQTKKMEETLMDPVDMEIELEKVTEMAKKREGVDKTEEVGQEDGDDVSLDKGDKALSDDTPVYPNDDPYDPPYEVDTSYPERPDFLPPLNKNKRSGPGTGKPVIIVNPKVIASSQLTHRHVEACFTLPNWMAYIRRPRDIKVEFTVLDDGPPRRDTWLLRGLLARSFLHEYDHMLGRLYPEHVDARGEIFFVPDTESPEHKEARYARMRELAKEKNDLFKGGLMVTYPLTYDEWTDLPQQQEDEHPESEISKLLEKGKKDFESKKDLNMSDDQEEDDIASGEDTEDHVRQFEKKMGGKASPEDRKLIKKFADLMKDIPKDDGKASKSNKNPKAEQMAEMLAYGPTATQYSPKKSSPKPNNNRKSL